MALQVPKKVQEYLDKEGFTLDSKAYPREDGSIQRRFIKTVKVKGQEKVSAEVWLNEKEPVKKESA